MFRAWKFAPLALLLALSACGVATDTGEVTDGGTESGTDNGDEGNTDSCTDPDGCRDGETSTSLLLADVLTSEADGSVFILLSLNQPSSDAASLNYITEDVTANAGSDYRASSGTITFAPGEQTEAISIDLIDDANAEDTESFRLRFSNAIGLQLSTNTVNATLLDDDRPEFDTHWLDDDSHFAAASDCNQCHSATAEGASPAIMRAAADDSPTQPSPTGEDISPRSDWQHSMMARAFDDPYYRAVVADEVAEFPDLAGLIENTCIRCHAPMAWWDAHQQNAGLDADGHLRMTTVDAQMSAREGVSCTLCHQIEDDGNLGSVAGFSGQFSIGDDKQIYGPYANPTGNAMLNHSGYQPAHGAHISSSEHCASCHNLYTPTLDVDSGQPTGEQFLEQGPYFEWQNSVFATGQPEERQCQQCHQGETADEAYASQIARKPDGSLNPNWPDRSPFRRHNFVGGNTHVLGLMQQFPEVLGIENSSDATGFQRQIELTRAQLQNETAELSLGSPQLVDGHLQIATTITNLSGHKFPTSYPSRRAWLHLKVEDADGNTLFESGAPDDSGRISTDATANSEACLAAHKPGNFDNNGCYEPHHDIISQPQQVAIYEAVLGDTHGDITHVLLHAAEYLKDNRIPPRGFTSDSPAYQPDTASVGVAGDDDFNRDGSGQDTVSYRIEVGDQTGPFRISARLLYQSIKPDFVGGLHGTADEVQRFKAMYRAVPPPVEVVAEAAVLGG